MSSLPPDDRVQLPAPPETEPSRHRARFPAGQWKGRVSVEPQRIFGTIVKLFVLSVVVGWVISVLDLSLEGFFEHLADAFGSVVDWARWTLSHYSFGIRHARQAENAISGLPFLCRFHTNEAHSTCGSFGRSSSGFWPESSQNS